jgi:membrane protein implicated in regulation of membrane protease activity
MDFLTNIEYWHWIALGAVLVVLEMLVPAAIFLWPGFAAIIIGLFSYISPATSDTVLIAIWGLVSVAMAGGYQYYKKNAKPAEKPSTINRRGEQYVGRHFTLAKDIVNGAGELHVDDTRCKIVSNADLPAGVRVKVISVEGTALRVEEYIS